MSEKREVPVRDLKVAIASLECVAFLPAGSVPPCDWPAGEYQRSMAGPVLRSWVGNDASVEMQSEARCAAHQLRGQL